MNAPLNWSDIASAGGFSPVEVARLINVPISTLRSWLHGANPVIVPDYEPLNGRLLMSFDAFVEARAIAYFAEELPLQRLREIMREFRAVTGERHPLAKDQQFVTDKFRILEVVGDAYVNVVNQVYAEPTLMAPALRGQVVWDNGAARYFMPDPKNLPLVRVDPRHAFGRPVIIENGRVVTTSALADSAEDEGMEEAADWFEVSSEAVRQAQQFENRAA
ncbi:hypothetical protein [Caulobacter sp. SSI4214]|uniref:hypothetical protein n=1 Tax=Caulobacter sp. SSI4214 TaxID=2575739 RepID=UPI00143CAAB9|nr:hypothetical protein [Caulobacter sp. SSI4214]